MNSAPDEPYSLQCMEVWGGNLATETFLRLPGLDAWLCCRPFAPDQSGGDVYHASLCNEGILSRFAVLDIAGHGPEVSHLAWTIRGLMHKYVNVLDQSEFARALNDDIETLRRPDKFATALLISHYNRNAQMVLCNAGHPPPLFYSAVDGDWRLLTPESAPKLEIEPNLPLGIVPGTVFSQYCFQMREGDVLIAYTDDFIEVIGREDPDNSLGTAGLKTIVAGLNPTEPETLVSGIVRAVDSYRGHKEAEDDQTLLVLHKRGSE